MKSIFIISLFLFLFLMSCIKGDVAQFNSTESSGSWVPVQLEKLQITRVIVDKQGTIFASVIDKSSGAAVIHSSDQGKTWTEVPVMGSNLAIAITNDNEVICGTGTKIYCIYLREGLPDPQLQNYELRPVSIEGSGHEIHSFGKRGIAFVGLFQIPYTEEYVNGISYNEFVGAPGWKFSDIGLKREEGYFAMAAAFPSETTWFVASGSWPVQNPNVHTMLSGRLNVAPGDDITNVNDYKYEFLSLRGIQKDKYFGAISRTTDGGKTWTKVFDSNNYFYINQIHCFNENSCVAVGEGSISSYILKTFNGGSEWEVALRLDGQYSLHTCKMISEKEIWVAGGMMVEYSDPNEPDESKRHSMRLLGIYYHSGDAGETWSMTSSDGYAYDMTFSSVGTAYAATIHNDHCSITQLLK